MKSSAVGGRGQDPLQKSHATETLETMEKDSLQKKKITPGHFMDVL